MRITVEIRRPGWMTSARLKRARPLVLLLALVFAAPVLAFDRFTDVGPGVHHNDISAIAAAGITQGCNPPDNTLYCPGDFVRRDQMGSFLARTAGLGGNPPVTNADKLDGLDSTQFARAPAEPWREVGANDQPPFNDGSGGGFCSWSNYDAAAGHNSAAFFKDPFGVVHLKGLVVATDGSDPCGDTGAPEPFIFILPEGYRPAKKEVHVSLSNNAVSRVGVLDNGWVTVDPNFMGNAETWLSLDGITFRAAP